MLFNSLEFALFLTIFFAAYWFVFRRLRQQNLFLLAASYLFYGWWDWRFLALIIFTTASSFLTAIAAKKSRPRMWTAINIVINLGILAAFKYLGFFAENIVRLFSLFGWNLDWVTIDILLPVGISFYTFQAIGYSVDVCRGEIEAQRNPITFAVFIAYFPQLVAGPIERSRTLMPQLERPRIWNRSDATIGLRLILWGLLKKVAIADVCAIYVDRIFGTSYPDAMHLLVAAILFTIQIYCDFSGYSEIARGVSKTLGIELTINFRYPFFSRNVIEIWHRWHISLMQWFTQYVYIPLGGSRRGKARTCINILIIFTLSGLWHGAAWNFVVWGVFWGIIYMIARNMGVHKYTAESMASMRKSGFGIILTFALFVYGFAIFRSPVEQLWHTMIILPLPLMVVTIFITLIWFAVRRIPLSFYIAVKKVGIVALLLLILAVCACAFLDYPVLPGILLKFEFLIVTIGMFAKEWICRDCDFALRRVSTRPMQRVLLYWLLILIIAISTAQSAEFIYFQF